MYLIQFFAILFAGIWLIYVPSWNEIEVRVGLVSIFELRETMIDHLYS